MSEVGKRVQLVKWPHGGKLSEGQQGTIIEASGRKLIVQWDNLSAPLGMSPEEVSLA